MYKFSDKYGFGGAFAHVHPYKQRAVKFLVDNVDDVIQYVIIFGSSTLPTCKRDSDIDVCIIGVNSEDFSSRNLRVPEEYYDFLTYPSTEEFLEEVNSSMQNVARSIYEEGVVVYARQNNLTG